MEVSLSAIAMVWAMFFRTSWLKASEGGGGRNAERRTGTTRERAMERKMKSW